MTDIVTPDDLEIYLGVTLDSTGVARAQMLIDDAIAQALSILWPGNTDKTEADLPAAAAGVIRAAVSRLYLNPQGLAQEVAGSFSIARSATSGSMFSTAETRALQRAVGRSGAFSVDLLPADLNLDEGLPWWDFEDVDGSDSSDSAS